MALATLFTQEEFKQALFNMQLDKSIEFDGLNLGFYQRFWTLSSNDIVCACNKWLEEGSIPIEVNGTNITLIPKYDNPNGMQDLLSISMCDILYKILSKALANRLRTVIGKCISREQFSLVKDHSILDNALIANELLHYMKKKPYN